MAVTWLWSGRLAATSFRVKNRIAGASARLAVADNEAMSGPAFYGPVAPSNNVCTLDATGLDPDTQYWYQVEDAGVLDTTKTGRAHTVVTPGTPYSFTFATSVCARGSLYPGNPGSLADALSNHPVFDEIRKADPLFFLHMGDYAYYNLGSNTLGIVGGGSLANYRSEWEDPLVYCPRQAELYRNVPLVHQYDDHDFGRNNEDGSNPNKDNAATTWRERFPDYAPASPNVAGDMGTYRSFVIGRVMYLITDLRYYRQPPTDPAPRTMLGASQLTWFESQLATGEAQGADMICWVSTQPSNSGGSTSWGSYSEERDSIYQMIGDHGWTSPRKRFFQIAGDQHMMGWDSGASGRGFPLFTMSPLDSTGGIVAGYDMGTIISSTLGQYGLFTFTDYGSTIRTQVDGMLTNV